MLAVLLRHIHDALLLGGKNLFQKAAHQFGRTVESIQIGFYVVPQVVVLVAPTNGLFLGGGKFFFQATVLHVHHIAVVGLLFQLGKFFFGQRVVTEKGALADIIQIARMNEGFFRERGLFLHSGKLLLFFGESGAGSGKRLFFLVDLRSQAVQTLLLPLDFELGDGRVFFSAATLTKEALIHARDLDYIGKRTFLGNYSLTEEEFSKLKKQADHGYMMDVENRRLKEELSTAKKEAVRWSNKYHDLWYDVKPYLDALHRAPELVRGFLEKILAPKQERTMNVPQRNRKRGQDMEL